MAQSLQTITIYVIAWHTQHLKYFPVYKYLQSEVEAVIGTAKSITLRRDPNKKQAAAQSSCTVGCYSQASTKNPNILATSPYIKAPHHGPPACESTSELV